MKRLLTTVLFFSVALLLLNSSIVLGGIPTVKLNLLTSQKVFRNGDKISIEGKGFAANDNIVAAVLVVHNLNGSIDYKILQKYELNFDIHGNLTGSATIESIDETDKFAQFAISTKYSSVVPTKKFAVQGDLSPFSNQMITGAGDFPSIEAGNFSFTEAGGDNIADLNEQLNITIPNSGWGSSSVSVALCVRREYPTGNGSGAYIASAFLPTANLSISGNQLSGFTNNGSQAYNTSTQTMRLDVMDDSTFTFGTSTNYFRTFADIIPPNLTSAYATALDTIKLVFNEAVSEVGGGDAAAKFDFGGSLGSGVLASAVLPVGTEPTTIWNLVISGLTDRSVTSLTVAYDSLNTGSTELEDDAGNIVKNTSPPITVADSIVPGVTTLRNSANTNALTVGTFIGNTTYTLYARVMDGYNDASLDGVVFEGSDDGSTWSPIGTDASITAGGPTGDDGDFSVEWVCSTEATQYKILRARAFDNAGASGTNNVLDTDDNVTISTVVGTTTDNLNNNFEDTYRAIITSVNPDPISASSGSVRSQITMEVQNNYGIPTNTTGQNNTFRFRETTTTTETWWNEATGGSSFTTSIDTTLASSATSLNVWYSNNAAGGPNTLVLQEPAGNFAAHSGVVSANGETITVQTGTASKIWIRFAGQTFTSGSGVSGTPNTHSATDTLVARLYVTDAADNLITSFNETRSVDFSTTASNAPDGTPPTVSGTSTLTGISVGFSNGTDTVVVRFPNAETGITLTADDPVGTPALTGVESNALTINPGSLQEFDFVMDSPQRDGYAVTGVNTITAWDSYQNVITSFNAATNNVTITRNSGPGTVTITGLGSANNNVLNQASDFVDGVADLTAQGMAIDASITGNYTLVATSSVVPTRTGISNSFAVNRVVDVSNPNTPDRTLMDTTATASDFTLSATLSGGEDPSVSDDFRILWGFNTTGNFGRPYGLERQSPDRTPGATIDYVVPASDVQNLDGGPYDYMFWWVENLSTNPNATILEGLPTVTNPRRLILNPNLITQGGINGGDVAQGAFTPGATDQEMVSILFGADPTIATIKINSLTFNKSGTATGTDISAFHLYRDGGSLGQYDSGVDILLRTYTYSGGNTITFGNLTDLLNITGNANYILVTVDVNSGAVPANTLGLVLANEQNISLVDNVFNGGASAITINSFSNLGTAGDYSLPVTLVSFQAHSGYGNIQLEWATASEENNDGFYIMRSENPEGEFTRLNEELIDGSGSVTTSHKYSFTDSEVTPEVIYYYKLYSVDYNGEVYAYKTLASSAAMPLPKSFSVYQNYPNPFNPTTRLKFDVPKQAAITIEIYNMLGQKIRTLVNNEIYQPGVYDHVIWDARDDHGYQVANGIYYMVFNAKDFNFRQVRKLVFMK